MCLSNTSNVNRLDVDVFERHIVVLLARNQSA